MEKKAPVFDIDDDEELSHGEHMLAGAMAGVLEHAIMHPVDTVKTRMQVYSGLLKSENQSAFRAARSIVEKEGVVRLWRGLPAVLVSAGPAHAVHFAAFEQFKQELRKVMGHQNPLATGAAGGLATMISEGIMVPLDVVKQRQQISSKKHARTISESVRYIYREHGLGAFYAGYRTSLLMAIPFTTVQYSVYEFAKGVILRRKGIGEQDFSAGSHCLAGAVAGGTASAVTTPLDVVKTRLQTQGEVGARRYRDLRHAMKTIYLEEGIRGLFRGVQPRVLFFTPAAAICWTTYELSKHTLGLYSEVVHTEDTISAPHT
ncbi:hypothetical protein NDN08_003000 [Rhodosorus marinus]|uniref:Mitochondrial carrier protein n=1 Tax=Rhodosorus marinus TaxID=101924 RepID=A0AAV8UZS2_9RHOD|nr:hypothetical protein NDN08_003000 [Rhodosorus marinus]